MFTSARLKLSAWYLLIIMLISISFSVAIYKVLSNELNRVERIQRLRQDLLIPFPLRYRFPKPVDPELVNESENRIKLILLLINLSILTFSSFAGYFLAGKTLKPIQDMVDEQNRFITDSSHELRTPLTSLKAEIEVNLRDPKLTLEQSKKLLRSNLEEVNNLQLLSDSLIKLTQFQKNTPKVNFDKVSLQEIINEAQKKLASIAKHKEITIKNLVKDYIIEADKQSLIEVFVIFLDNAIKYSPSKTTVSIDNKKNDGSIIIEIKDQGIGINQKDIPYLFDRFYRVDKSRTKTNIDGFGLGLSIAKQIIDKHSGSIKISSKERKGTSFFIQLPLKQ